MQPETPDRVLLRKPRWRSDDLGQPLPPSPHAVSVCLPCWQDVVDYEEKRERVLSRLQSGYPRFVVPPAALRYFEAEAHATGRTDTFVLAFSTARAADRCVEAVRRWTGASLERLVGSGGASQLVRGPFSLRESALKYWRHTGDGISSRRAEALLSGVAEPDAADAKQRVRERIAKRLDVPVSSVFLFPAGMTAIYAVHRALCGLKPGRRCAQFGFPYVDTLKILQEFGSGALFLPRGDASDLRQLSAAIASEPFAGVFCEFPSNPLLNTPDITSLKAACHAQGVPLVVDETIASYANANLITGADVVVSSLTKYFTGRGDVMAGAAVISPSSPMAAELKAALEAEFEDSLWGGDALLVDAYSVDFEERMQQVNRNAEQLCAWLANDPRVQHVFHPSRVDRDRYDAFRTERGGYSGLFSLVLRDAERVTPRFYDALALCKGPNLGTTFSLACPFTLLAHYGELDWAEQCGVSRYLIRFSIGLEALDHLKDVIRAALNHASDGKICQ